MSNTSQPAQADSGSGESSEESHSQDTPPVLIDFLAELNTGLKRLAQ